MDPFDVYLAYASEDSDFAELLHEALKKRGISVWKDTLQIQVGPTLRAQMELGLAQSTFGVVILSPRFFAKRWTIEELEGLFALETPEQIRILPVWFEIDQQRVVAESPMLAARAAAVFRGDIEEVAQKLVRSVFNLGARRSLASLIRAEISTGLKWVGPVEFFARSLACIDEQPGRFVPAEVIIYPDMPSKKGKADSKFLSLPELHAASSVFDGVFISTIAHQIAGTIQILADRGPARMLWDDSPQAARIVSYVFQLRSVASSDLDLTYVQAFHPYEPGSSLPPAPEDWLTWIVGIPIARGTTDADGYRFTSYLLASSILYIPRVEAGGRQISFRTD